MKKWLLLLIGFFSHNTQAQTGTCIHYGIADGLNTHMFYSVTQDTDGFIWIASNAGAYRFDGSRFIHYSVADGLPDNEILNVFPDKDGNIWFFGFNGKIGYYRQGRFFHPGNHPVLANAILRDIPVRFYEGNNHVIHIQSERGTDLLISMVAGHAASIRRRNHTTAYWENGADRYTNYWGIIYKNGTPACRLPIEDPTNISTITGNEFHLISRQGIYTYRQDSLQLLYPWPHTHAYPLRIFVPQPGKTFVVDRQGKIMALIKEGGHYTLSHRYTAVHAPSRIFIDRDNGVWITSLTYGLYYYPHEQSSYYQPAQRAPLPGDNITSLSLSKDRVFAGYVSGAVISVAKDLSSQSVFRSAADRKYEPVRQLLFMPAMKKLVVTDNRSIDIIPANGSRSSNRQISMLSIKDISADKKGGLLVVSNNLIMKLFTGGKDSAVFVKSINRNYAASADTFSGNIWYSTREGLQQLGKTAIRLKPHPFLRERIRYIMVMNRHLVLGTENEGIALMDRTGSIVQVITPALLRNEIVTQIKVEKETLWVGGSAGISVFSYDHDTLRRTCRIDHNSQLLSDQVQGFGLDDSFLYVAGPHELQRLDRRSLQQNIAIPRLFIDAVSYGNTTVLRPGNTLHLPANTHEIRLHCAALEFANTAKAQFAYRFGQGGGLVELNDPVFTVPLGMEGQADLFLRCRKGDSEWSAETHIHLDIAIPWYRRTWVLALLCCAFTLLAARCVAFFAGRARRRQSREKEMKQQMALLEMRALQSMMNPHFIFNALNSIQYFLHEQNVRKVNKYLSAFAFLVRSSLNNNKETLIPLRTELAYIRNYLELEQLRLEKKLHFEFDIDARIDQDEVCIPVMLLQPLIENAIIHGIRGMEDGGHIKISIFLQQQELFIEVQDNGTGLRHTAPRPEWHKSMGLETIRHRLQLLSDIHGTPYSFDLKDNKASGRGDRGVTALLKLPLQLKPQSAVQPGAAIQ